jgi:hypothetical protein
MIKVSKHPLERNSYIISKGQDFTLDDWDNMLSWLNNNGTFYLDAGILHFKDDQTSLMFALKYL